MLVEPQLACMGDEERRGVVAEDAILRNCALFPSS